MVTRLALVALLAACGSKKTPTEACAEAAKHGVEAMINQARARISTAELPEDVKARVMDRQQKLEQAGTKMRAVFTNRCVDDKWSGAVLACYNKSVSLEDMRACRKQMSPEQQAKLQRDELDLLAGNTGPQNFGGAQADPLSGVAADPRITMITSAIADAKKALAEATTDADKATAQAQIDALEVEKKTLEAQVAKIAADQLAALESEVATRKAHLDAVTADKSKSDKDRASATADYNEALARFEQAKKSKPPSPPPDPK
jgi:hypothetical protein